MSTCRHTLGIPLYRQSHSMSVLAKYYGIYIDEIRIEIKINKGWP